MSVAKEYFSSTLLISFSQPTRHEHLVDTSLPHLVIGRDGRGGANFEDLRNELNHSNHDELRSLQVK